VQAAEELLAERGSAEQVPVAEIVRRVGVTAPVLYQHFADKDALFVAVHARRMDDFRDALRRAGRRTTSPLDALEQRGRAYIRYATTKPDTYAALFMTPKSLPHEFFSDPSMRALSAFDDLVGNIRACIDADQIPAADPEVLARVVWAQVHGLASLLITMPEIARTAAERSALVERLVAAITAGLVAGTAASH
jgi:AcrR family transcriptional regulator